MRGLLNFEEKKYKKIFKKNAAIVSRNQFTSAEITGYGQKGPKTVIFHIFAGFSTLGNDCEVDFELTFDSPTED